MKIHEITGRMTELNAPGATTSINFRVYRDGRDGQVRYQQWGQPDRILGVTQPLVQSLAEAADDYLSEPDERDVTVTISRDGLASLARHIDGHDITVAEVAAAARRAGWAVED